MSFANYPLHCVAVVLMCNASLVPSLHCQFFFVCRKVFFFPTCKKKSWLAVETGYEASVKRGQLQEGRDQTN